MIRCPECDCKYTVVVDSRRNSKQQTIRRRRECQRCHHRFRTYEVREADFGKNMEKLRRQKVGNVVSAALAAIGEADQDCWIVKG